MRRQFTAEYRQRILEEAESLHTPGEVGRLLAPRGVPHHQLASDGLAQGAAQGSLRRRAEHRDQRGAKDPRWPNATRLDAKV